MRNIKTRKVPFKPLQRATATRAIPKKYLRGMSPKIKGHKLLP